MKQRLTISLSPEVLKTAKDMAKDDNRSLSNVIEMMLKQAMKNKKEGVK